jgi:hypothetical protein
MPQSEHPPSGALPHRQGKQVPGSYHVAALEVHHLRPVLGAEQLRGDGPHARAPGCRLPPPTSPCPPPALCVVAERSATIMVQDSSACSSMLAAFWRSAQLFCVLASPVLCTRSHPRLKNLIHVELVGTFVLSFVLAFLVI